MRCTKPLKAYRDPKGGITFNQNAGHVPIQLPCNNCMACRISYSQQWAVRAMHESMSHEQNSFITLTYDNEHLPTDLGLHHDHFQKFMKRLRKALPNAIRYLMCGEYGEERSRPHYHALLFGTDFSHDKVIWKTYPSKLYRSPTLEKAWTYGHSSIGEVNYTTANYVAGYIRKKIKGKGLEEINAETGLRPYELYDPESGEIIQRIPEYAQMSRTPGLGYEFFQKHKDQILGHDHVVIDGHRVRVPKYYDKLASDDQRHARNKSKRMLRTQRAKRDRQERLDAKEAYLHAVTSKAHKRTGL